MQPFYKKEEKMITKDLMIIQHLDKNHVVFSEKNDEKEELASQLTFSNFNPTRPKTQNSKRGA